ncbi:sensor domain-containing diguanylate cyclase [Effusibacillus dendaii]|uniref:Diguanylate cyclase n=1 Tax=Effusibacillus dendaii TaxID=2743772 RepID=A0A7I8DGY2_9BACL|nr:sensor domain-containing diguanylate cyclase [Effusibacillus dendaii]BCJ88612.1 hypothetical protein skT53_35970 [Effusibacillus dendaii]
MTINLIVNQEQWYKYLFEQYPDPIFSLDLNGNFTSINPAGEKLVGYTKEEIQQMSFMTLLQSDLKEDIMRVLQKAIQGESQHYRSAINNKNGDVIYLDITNIPIVMDGEIVGVYGIAKDITERKQMEDQLAACEENYRLISEHMKDLIIVLDVNGVVQYVSPSHKTLLGFDINEIEGNLALDLVHPPDIAELITKFKEMFQTKTSIQVIFHYQCKDGSTIPVEATAIPVLTDENKVENVVVVARDIRDRIATRQALQESEKQYRLIAEYSADVIRVVTVDGAITYASPAHHSVLGFEPETFIGKSIYYMIHPEDFHIVKSRFEELFSERQPVSYEVRRKHSNGSYIWLETYVTPVFDEQGNIFEVVGVSRDVSQRKHAEERLLHLAYHDALTDLPNRRLFKDRVDQAIKNAKRNRLSLAVFYLDCDKFKSINDTFGHDVGDQIIMGFAERIRACVREQDTVGRIGGDEFVVLLPNIQTPNDAVQVANRILESIQEPWQIEDNAFNNTTSIGISLYPTDGEDPETLIKQADRALYMAKQAGGNTFRFYTS